MNNIFIGLSTYLKDDDSVHWRDCSYSQLAERFRDEWKIKKHREKDK